MKAKKFNKIRNELITQLQNIDYDGDMTDIGNEIGIVIGRYKHKYFCNGLKHGVSLSNGTH